MTSLDSSMRTHRATPAFSVTELVMTIAILGVLASVVVMSLHSLMLGSKDTIAIQRVEMLNEALNRWAMAGQEIRGVPIASDQDEHLIVMTLQLRNEMMPGSPFLDPRFSLISSNDTADHRIRFNGVRFELLAPGAPGMGLKVRFDGADMGQPRIHPAGFKSYGQ